MTFGATRRRTKVIGRLPGERTCVTRIAGLTMADGVPLRVVPHQLRHTYATELVNAGMSLQALMALLGHSPPEMTLRYATLAPGALQTGHIYGRHPCQEEIISGRTGLIDGPRRTGATVKVLFLDRGSDEPVVHHSRFTS